jgi:hypothetical protein
MQSAKPKDSHPAEAGSLPTVLEAIAKRLTAQPMLFGLGVLVLLSIAAGVLRDRLNVLIVAALAIFVIATGTWFSLELVKARAAKRDSTPHGKADAGTVRSGVHVEVTADRVGKTGSVVGIEGLPTSVRELGVRVAGTNNEGNVTGARYASGSEQTDDNRKSEK